MSFQDILLIILSSAGLLHGVALAVFLCFIKQKRNLAHFLIGAILFFMALRIGKSVALNFSAELEVVYIFLGLSFLLLIGPILRWYTLAMTQPDFTIRRKLYVEMTPFLFMVAVGLIVSGKGLDMEDDNLVIGFGSSLLSIYMHLAVYIFISYKSYSKVRDAIEMHTASRSQKLVIDWLTYLTIGYILIWIAYFLNIVESTVPYVTGPIIYSVVIYFLSYKAWKLKILDLDGDVFRQNDNHEWYKQVVHVVEEGGKFLDPELSLAGLGKLLNISPQKTSEIINQCAGVNFNDFINQLRINEAKKRLLDNDYAHLNISSIAYDVGFNSLSSFNYAFKKFIGQTPSSFRKDRAS